MLPLQILDTLANGVRKHFKEREYYRNDVKDGERNKSQNVILLVKKIYRREMSVQQWFQYVNYGPNQ